MAMPDATRSPSLAAAWGRQLKLYREAAGLTQEQLAQQLGYSRSLIGNLEVGSYPPSIPVAEECDTAVEAKGRLIQLRADLVGIEVVPQWFRYWIEIEQQATMLRGYESVVVPGLLQTEAYARAVLEGDPGAVEARMERQTILSGQDPPLIRYLVEESVLGRPFGDSDTMYEQLGRLASPPPGVSVQVVPLGAVATTGAFALASLEGAELGYIDGATQGIVVTRRDEVVAIERAYEAALAEALPSRASQDMIRRMAEQWKT